ncbi:hypothetical protein PCANC_19696 [Puccinia coronata f. sp. avenae]|uniref:Uncharacterized protein n=1 Tax=Puccinia coronata f. sp. avenae TaxID=200324 RepID=A0A2N5SAX5_9BASI|nr:hypothetical protein PCANC_19696 [Puccinia coronata f. sp. avenae]
MPHYHSIPTTPMMGNSCDYQDHSATDLLQPITFDHAPKHLNHQSYNNLTSLPACCALPPDLDQDRDDSQKLSGCLAFAVVQLLALAICNHTTDKLTSVTKLFISKPGLISQLSKLVNLEISGEGLGGNIQAAVFHALEEILQYCPPSSLVTFTLNMVTLVIIRIN